MPLYSLWLMFKSIVLYCVTNYVPKTKRLPKNNPWITREVIQAKRRLKRLRRTIKIKGGDEFRVTKLPNVIAEFKLTAKRAKEYYFNVTLPPAFLLIIPEDSGGTFAPLIEKRLTYSQKLRKPTHITFSFNLYLLQTITLFPPF